MVELLETIGWGWAWFGVCSLLIGLLLAPVLWNYRVRVRLRNELLASEIAAAAYSAFEGGPPVRPKSVGSGGVDRGVPSGSAWWPVILIGTGVIFWGLVEAEAELERLQIAVDAGAQSRSRAQGEAEAAMVSALQAAETAEQVREEKRQTIIAGVRRAKLGALKKIVQGPPEGVSIPSVHVLHWCETQVVGADEARSETEYLLEFVGPSKIVRATFVAFGDLDAADEPVEYRTSSAEPFGRVPPEWYVGPADCSRPAPGRTTQPDAKDAPVRCEKVIDFAGANVGQTVELRTRSRIGGYRVMVERRPSILFFDERDFAGGVEKVSICLHSVSPILGMASPVVELPSGELRRDRELDGFATGAVREEGGARCGDLPSRLQIQGERIADVRRLVIDDLKGLQLVFFANGLTDSETRLAQH